MCFKKENTFVTTMTEHCVEVQQDLYVVITLLDFYLKEININKHVILLFVLLYCNTIHKSKKMEIT